MNMTVALQTDQDELPRRAALEELAYGFAGSERCRATIRLPREIDTDDTLVVVATRAEIENPQSGGVWAAYTEEHRDFYLWVPPETRAAAIALCDLHGIRLALLGTWYVRRNGNVVLDF